MYSLTKNTALRDMVLIETPSFLASLAVAQIFFKFGNFSLELLGFLTLWWSLSAGVHKLSGKSRKEI